MTGAWSSRNSRAGSANSPLWVGGGIAFGPHPRSYDQKVNRKLKRLGLRSAYSIKASEDRIKVVEDFSPEVPKTKEVAVLKLMEQLKRRCAPKKSRTKDEPHRTEPPIMTPNTFFNAFRLPRISRRNRAAASAQHQGRLVRSACGIPIK